MARLMASCSVTGLEPQPCSEPAEELPCTGIDFLEVGGHAVALPHLETELVADLDAPAII